MYVSIRRYEGVPAENIPQIQRLVQQGFVPLISQAEGFVAFYAVDAGEGVIASISIFDTEQGVMDSNGLAADWVRENLAHLIPNPPQITDGPILFKYPKEA
ncbi:MAG: hypothetical protein D6737_05655 [Chloroflexi bacterium]|nr:MAG: hypothetical protein D6737_05655 [Chloroflexota bacterium]